LREADKEDVEIEEVAEEEVAVGEAVEADLE
jgi:hypothetical protein